MAVQSALDPDLDVVKVDKYGNFQSVLYHNLQNSINRAASAASLFLRNLNNSYFVCAAGRNVDFVALLVRHKMSQHLAAGRDRPGLETAVFGVESDDCVG